jgi:hypothetical protein
MPPSEPTSQYPWPEVVVGEVVTGVGGPGEVALENVTVVAGEVIALWSASPALVAVTTQVPALVTLRRSVEREQPEAVTPLTV